MCEFHLNIYFSTISHSSSDKPKAKMDNKSKNGNNNSKGGKGGSGGGENRRRKKTADVEGTLEEIRAGRIDKVRSSVLPYP